MPLYEREDEETLYVEEINSNFKITIREASSKEIEKLSKFANESLQNSPYTEKLNIYLTRINNQ